jgi:hypothetical protein
MVFRRLVLLLVLSSTLLISTASQQRAQKQKPSSKAQPGLAEEVEQLRLSAISLLHSLAQSANEIETIDDRVTVLAEIGDAFWPVDREYSRTLLLHSFKEIDKLPPGVDDMDLPQAGGFAEVLSRVDFNEAISLAKMVNKKPFALMAQAVFAAE